MHEGTHTHTQYDIKYFKQNSSLGHQSTAPSLKQLNRIPMYNKVEVT